MGIKKHIVLFLGFIAVLCSATATAQSYPEYTRNYEDPFDYTVEQDTTICALSRLVSVQTDLPLAPKPDTKSSLAIGQEIYIQKRKTDNKSAPQAEVK